MVATNNSLQNDFFNWLNDKVSVPQMSELFFIYPEIEDFCQKSGLLKQPLFQTANLLTISLVKKMVETNPAFHSLYKRKLRKMVDAMDLYYRYLRERKASAAEKPLIEQPAAAPAPCNHYFDIAKQPAALSYFGEKQPIEKSWQEVYIKLMQCLYEDYPDTLLELSNKSIAPDCPPSFSDDAACLTAPFNLADNLYLETQVETAKIAENMQKMLDCCLIDYENVTIDYL